MKVQCPYCGRQSTLTATLPYRFRSHKDPKKINEKTGSFETCYASGYTLSEINQRLRCEVSYLMESVIEAVTRKSP